MIFKFSISFSHVLVAWLPESSWRATGGFVAWLKFLMSFPRRRESSPCHAELVSASFFSRS
ncbi:MULTISPECIES: hypothetical protein [unclassified Rickettsia]|uniref:hypothetical protein n=1 Tax=unclassified Rickettsia TaxID=114295 RepID=UPI0031331514